MPKSFKYSKEIEEMLRGTFEMNFKEIKIPIDIPDLAVSVGSKKATAHEVIHKRLNQRWHAPENIKLPKKIRHIPQLRWVLSRITSLQFTFILQFLLYIAFLLLLMYVVCQSQ